MLAIRVKVSKKGGGHPVSIGADTTKYLVRRSPAEVQVLEKHFLSAHYARNITRDGARTYLLKYVQKVRCARHRCELAGDFPLGYKTSGWLFGKEVGVLSNGVVSSRTLLNSKK